MDAIMQAALYAFGGSAWTFFLLNVQERFFWPDDLTPRQSYRLETGKWWISLIGAIGGLLVFWAM